MAVVGNSLQAFTYPFRSTSPGIAAWALNTASDSSQVESPVPPSSGYPVSIAGRNYMIDTSFEPYRREAFRHKSIPPQRQSLHFTNIPDDGTVSTEGLWRREARDWSMGSGQIYVDRHNSADSRFYRSKGINPWTQWNLTLHDDVVKQSPTATKAIRVGKYVYFTDGATVKFFSSAWSNAASATTLAGSITEATVTHTFTGTILDLCTDGYNVYVVTNFGIYQFAVGAASPVHQLVDGGTLTTAVLGAAITTTTATTMTVTNYAQLPTAATATPSSYYYVEIDSEYLQVTNTAGATFTVVRHALGTTAVTHANNTPVNLANWAAFNSAFPLSATITWAGDRLIATFSNLDAWNSNSVGSEGAQIFDLSFRGGKTQIGGASPTYGNAYGSGLAGNKGLEWIYTHPNPNWKWTGVTAGSSQIYFAGHSYDPTSPDPGLVYRIGLQANSVGGSTGTVPGLLTYPVVCLPMPAGEYPTTIRSYLNYIFLGTNKGIRMCMTLNSLDPTGSSGDLKAGPLIPNITQPLSQPVTAIVGYDRYIYWAWNNYDSTSTGLGRLDLTTFIGEESPAYASDLMITGQGTINWLDWDPITDTPLISAAMTSSPTGAGNYLYTGDKASCVSTGSIDSGLITYGIPDNKNAIILDFNVTNTGTNSYSSVNMKIATDNAATVDLGTYYGTSPKASLEFDNHQFGEQYRLTTILNAGKDTSLNNVSPVLNRWTLKALPGIPSGTMIMAVLLMYQPTDVDGTISYQDPYGEYEFLESIRQSQKVVTYVEGPYSALVTVDLIDWLPERRRPITQGGYHGNLVVTLKTISG